MQNFYTLYLAGFLQSSYKKIKNKKLRNRPYCTKLVKSLYKNSSNFLIIFILSSFFCINIKYTQTVMQEYEMLDKLSK